ncbi:MAG: LuxR C-terminal-related transcriptional regulator, partial [Candidatus Baltobacteraceae bacterium]
SQLRSRSLPQQYGERFASALAEALWSAWRGDFSTVVAIASIAGSASLRSRAERALCSALEALGQAVLGEVSLSRRQARYALALASLHGPSPHSPLDTRYQRIARTVAAAACVIVGDTTRGRRALTAKGFRGDADMQSLFRVVDSGRWEAAPPRIRGYARAIAEVRQGVASSLAASPLTPSEIAVLQLLADGKSAPEIARSLGRSVYTVRAHTRAIIEKFNAHGRFEAISRARRAGYLR